MTEALTDTMTEDALFELLSLECRVGSDGTIRYYNAPGQWHRVHGPAIERVDGSKFWYKHGRRHRLDGPALERADGSRAWWQNGQLHRVDGPAVEYSDGRYAWYINGNLLTEAEWQQQVASMEAVWLKQ